MMRRVLVLNNFVATFAFTRLVTALRVGLYGFAGAWRCCRTLVPALPDYKGGDALYGCNSLEWNDHSASLRLLCPLGMPGTPKTVHSTPSN